MRRFASVSLVLLLLFVPAEALSQGTNVHPNDGGDKTRPLTQADKDAVVEAIQDEMYVSQLQPEVIDVGVEVSSSEYQMEAYFKPTLNKDGEGWIIYKLMPYGEVSRMFEVDPSGLGVLYGRLRNRFPPTEPSYLTVYMDDDELCRMKKDWGKSYFTVELKPSAKRIAEARVRQRRRKAYLREVGS